MKTQNPYRDYRKVDSKRSKTRAKAGRRQRREEKRNFNFS